MTTIARSVIGTLRLQDDMLKQACDRIKELERENQLMAAHIRILELNFHAGRARLNRARCSSPKRSKSWNLHD